MKGGLLFEATHSQWPGGQIQDQILWQQIFRVFLKHIIWRCTKLQNWVVEEKICPQFDHKQVGELPF